MSPRFDWALPFVLKHEGGWSCHPDDPGGATYAGVTLEALRLFGGGDIDHDGDVDADDVALLRDHPDIVADVFRGAYWAPWLDQLASARVAAKVLDGRVNVGQERGARLLQQALVRGGWVLSVDGSVGPQTIRACDDAGADNVLGLIVQEAQAYYWGLVQSQISRRACAPWNGKPSLGWSVGWRQDALNAIAARNLKALAMVRDAAVSAGRRPGLAVFMGGWLARAEELPPEPPPGV